jgi:hypothetical protein
MTLQDAIADADLKRLQQLVFDSFVAHDAEADRGGAVSRDTFALVPDYDGLGEVLAVDQLHPEDRDAAKDWFTVQWRRESAALMRSALYLGEPYRMAS